MEIAVAIRTRITVNTAVYPSPQKQSVDFSPTQTQLITFFQTTPFFLLKSPKAPTRQARY